MSLPELSVLGIEVFVFPIAATLWFNTKTYGGATTAAAISYFWFLVRVGQNLSDPLLTLSPLSPDFARAVMYYFLYFPLLILLGTLVGQLINILMDIGEPIASYRLFPSFRTHNIDNVVSAPCNPVDIAALRDFYCACESRGLSAFCFTHIEPNYWAVFIGLILVIITLFAPSFIFWILFPRNKWLAFVLGLAMAILGYFAAWFYWSYWTDLGTWGPTEYNMAVRLESIRKDPSTSVYAEDPDISSFAPALYAETQARVNKTVLVMALVHLFGFLLIGGLIVVPNTPVRLTVITIVGIVYLVVIAFIVALLAFITFSQKGFQPMCARYCPRTGKLLPLANTLPSSLSSKKRSLGNKLPSSTSRAIVPFQAKMKNRHTYLDGIAS